MTLGSPPLTQMIPAQFQLAQRVQHRVPQGQLAVQQLLGLLVVLVQLPVDGAHVPLNRILPSQQPLHRWQVPARVGISQKCRLLPNALIGLVHVSVEAVN